MRLQKLTCPNCCGVLDMEIANNTTSVFCPYCGQKFFLDDEKREYTINRNTNKNVTINKSVHKRYTDDAEVIKAKNADKENKRLYIALFLSLVFLIGMVALPWLVMDKMDRDARDAISQGKINAGYCRDLFGEDYQTVRAHFEAAGFTNIELIDLNDSGIAFWREGKVEAISIGGDTYFESTDYYDPDTKVVISYH